MSQKPNQAESLVALAIYGALLSGLAGVFVAIFAFVAGEWLSAGVCFGFSGIVFSLIAHALLRP